MISTGTGHRTAISIGPPEASCGPLRPSGHSGGRIPSHRSVKWTKSWKSGQKVGKVGIAGPNLGLIFTTGG